MKSRSSLIRRLFAVGVVWAVAGIGAVSYAQAPPPSTAPQPAAPLLSPQQLDDLVAPIALYPDPMLSQVLAASTYPLEVVEAEQWLQKNGGLSGTALMDAARQQNWDPSVQALVAFPNVLSALNQDVQWTTQLGNAFLAQQADVMSAVQRMRASARANGKLNSSPQQTVTTDTQNGQSAIEIQPANPQVIYVPTYDPAYIWGPPLYGYYPSLLYPSYGFGFWPGFDVGLYFGGWGFGGWGGWGGWGWGPNWFGHGIFVNHAFFSHYGFRGGIGGFAGRGAWAHDASHRLGVAYPNRALSQRYQAASRAGAARMGSQFSGRSSVGGYRGSQFRSGYGNRAASPSQGFRGTSPQSGARSFQSSPRYQSRGSYQSAPRSSAPAQRFGGAARSYNGGSTRSFGGGAARSFGGGTRSFGSGGGSRSFGGGGHSFGGSGGHSGGGHGGRR